LRLPQLLSEPSAEVLVVYRNPLACALSLHRQHLNFCTIQKREPFVREYMALLMHREFGLDHLRLQVASPGGLSPMVPDYWLHYWCGIHEWLGAQQALGFRLLNHDQLIARPRHFMSALFQAIEVGQGIEEATNKIRAEAIPHAAAAGFTTSLVEQAMRIHAKLSVDPRNLVPGVPGL
jgi:hypothetical protein